MRAAPAPRRVVVTGIGVVSAAGTGVPSLQAALRDGRSRVGPITRFDPTPFRSRIAAEVSDFDATDHMEPRQARRLDRFAQFAIACGRMAVKDAALSLNGSATDAAVYVGSALGGIAFAEAQHERFMTGGLRAVDPALALAVFGGAGATALAMDLDVRGPAVGNANSCASGAIAIGEAFRLVRSGETDVALAGGAEAPLAPLTFGAFTAIRAMSTRNADPAAACRPFDSGRDGFVMGEGAAILVLEELGHALQRDARIYAEVCGYGSTNDAYHPTAPRPDGAEAARAMRRALADAALDPSAVDYVNAHGSSTPLGDRAEAVALRTVFGDLLPTVPVSGTKPLYGHPLGASGAIEAVVVCLALESGLLPAAVNFTASEPDSPEAALDLVGAERPSPAARPEAALSNAFGFGGINASLVFRRCQT